MKGSIALVLVLVACADSEPVETVFEGPGLDAESGSLVAQDAPFLVGITELHVKNAPGPGKRFGDHAEAIGTHLLRDEPEGFVGVSFRNVGKLEWYTLTVWTDEAAMMDFVVSAPHVDAMVEISDLAKRARSTHREFPSGEAPPTWDWALDELSTEGWILGEAP